LNSKLTKSFKFTNFIGVVGFMINIVIEIKKMNHHSKWFCVYNQLKIDLATYEIKV